MAKREGADKGKGKTAKKRKGLIGKLLPSGIGDLAYVVAFVAIAYYKGWHYSLLNLWQEAMGTSPAQKAAVAQVEASMKSVRDGKSIAVTDLLPQLRHFCDRGATKDCAGYLAEVPKVVAAIKSGPGTWDRKPLKEDIALDIDRRIAAVASLQEADGVRADLRSLAKELSNSCPKSLQNDLKSLMVLEPRLGEEA
mmetsp:Transcript_51063/g.129765  ORF Transcript_51063/g.129765 Transcript_51063/m.129765 type:complete len:195 (+) Transcript_51063:91-675(+)